MRIKCPNCDTDFKIPEGIIDERGRFVRCSHCGYEWLAQPDELLEEVEQAIGNTIEQETTPMKTGEGARLKNGNFVITFLASLTALLLIMAFIALVLNYFQPKNLSDFLSSSVHNMITSN